MPQLIKAEQSAHWYARETGEPCYEIPKKNGKGMKRPTIRDARELNLVPSVTGIVRMIAKPELDAWKQEQVLKACYENPHDLDGVDGSETVEQYAKRVMPIANQARDKAADHGSAVHDAIHLWLNGEHYDGIYADYVETFAKWFLKESASRTDFGSEVCIRPIHGYGGRFDLQFVDRDGVFVFADYKVQNKADDKPFNFYDDLGLQLTAYKRAQVTNDAHCRLVSVLFSAVNPKRIEIKEWQDEEKDLWDVFQCCFKIWRRKKRWLK